MYKDEKEFNKAKGMFFACLKEENYICLEPEEKCTEKLIRSHSIQDSRILEQLAQDNHVYMFKLDYSPIRKATISNPQMPQIEFKLISIHEASTFKGLCNPHDTEIFKPIDTENIDLDNPKHTFLLFYRTIIKELASLINASKMMQRGYLKKVESGLLPENVPCEEGLKAVSQMMNTYDMYLYKKKIDETYVTHTFENVYSEHFVLENDPTFAVSTIFTPLEMRTKFNRNDANDVERIGINVFPYREKILVLLSCLYEEKQYMMNYISELLSANGCYKKYLLSKLILRNCENIVFSPKYINSFSAIKKSTILDFFTETMFTDKQDYDNENLYLF